MFISNNRIITDAWYRESLFTVYVYRLTALLLANYLVVIFTIISVTFACIPLNSELNMVQRATRINRMILIISATICHMACKNLLLL